MQKFQESFIPDDSEFLRNLQSARYHRKKAEISLSAGIYYIKEHAVTQDIHLLYHAAYYFRTASHYSIEKSLSRINLLSKVFLARIDVIESRHEVALTKLVKLEKEVDTLQDKEIRATWCYTMALLYQYHGDNTLTITYGKEALDLFSQIGSFREIITCLFNLGVDYREIGDYTTAIEYFSKALELGLEHNSPFLEYFYIEVGKIYLLKGNTSEGLKFVEQAATILHMKNDYEGLIYAYTTIALHYSDVNNLEDAFVWFNKCLNISEQHNVHNTFFVLSYADTCYKVKNFSGALELYEEALAVSRIRNDLVYIAKSENRISSVLIELGDFKTALNLAEESLSFFSTASYYTDELCILYQNLSTIYEKQKNTAKALEYQKLYCTWKSKWFEQQREIDIQKAKQRLDLETTAREQEELKVKTLELQHQLTLQRAEVTALAITLSQKNEFIDKLHTRIKELSLMQESATKDKCKTMIQEIESLRQSGPEQWETLQKQFESIDESFQIRLTKQFNELTNHEIKVCMLMRLNLSSKDIANILWTSPRTIETHRYSIRKKLNLNKEENLYSFLVKV
ncbi:MAG: tetratricopeptide repeat protein [Bacteriodetes bacterium]|nr:tetratricopeptide repeat protein [Bacteroidota bacterium]